MRFLIQAILQVIPCRISALPSTMVKAIRLTLKKSPSFRLDAKHS
ncbi:hypothetical protein EVA_12762 [gut metagenome]|uniref:Uncharacterized protein n=1 Tax=gut metagenome TaxID=749906 RepID=J9FX77_9ZZZZ